MVFVKWVFGLHLYRYFQKKTPWLQAKGRSNYTSNLPEIGLFNDVVWDYKALQKGDNCPEYSGSPSVVNFGAYPKEQEVHKINLPILTGEQMGLIV